MIRREELDQVLDGHGNVLAEDGTKIGSIEQIFLDDETSKPEWVTTKTGMFGGSQSFVPLANATRNGSDLQVSFSKDTVKDAPRVDDSEGHLSQDQEAELYRYYGLEYSERTSDSGLPSGETSSDSGAGSDTDASSARGTVGHDTSGPTTDTAMTRSEEQVRVGTNRVSTGKVRLRKYVVTENVTTTVPVTREEVRVEREPITDANLDAATSGGDITEEEHEVETFADQVVVDKDVVPVERVRLDKDVVTDQREVSETVRKEQIDTDDDSADITVEHSQDAAHR